MVVGVNIQKKGEQIDIENSPKPICSSAKQNFQKKDVFASKDETGKELKF